MPKSGEDQIKQVIIVRADLDLGKGKLAAQVSHASLESYFAAQHKDPNIAKEWIDTGQKKIVVKVDDEASLLKLFKAFEYKGIPCSLISDAGLTQVPPGTKTALGVGPWRAEEIDAFTKTLKLL